MGGLRNHFGRKWVIVPGERSAARSLRRGQYQKGAIIKAKNITIARFIFDMVRLSIWFFGKDKRGFHPPPAPLQQQIKNW